MTPGKNNKDAPRPGRHENPLPHEISQEEKKSARSAHDEAEKDMDNDAELSAHNPNEDLDEEESARLGNDETGLV